MPALHAQEAEAMIKTLAVPAPQATCSTPAQTAIADTAALVLAANAKRKGFSAQNTGTTVIKLAFGATNPTQTVYHVALAACTAADDGKGGIYFDDAFTGEVRAISSAAGGTFVIAEFLTGSPDWNQAGDLGLV
jgi:hypothetical protein